MLVFVASYTLISFLVFQSEQNEISTVSQVDCFIHRQFWPGTQCMFTVSKVSEKMANIDFKLKI